MEIAHLDFSKFPLKPGVYLMKNSDGKVIYVGKAKQLRTRLRQYFNGHDTRTMIPVMLKQLASIDTIVAPTDKEALILEHTLIKKHKPKFNVLLKDDKTFIGVAVNHKHEWPMISLVRFKGKPPKDLKYFGPYTNALAARHTVDLLNRLFPLRECSDNELKRRSRPCILYSMKRCSAPCANLISHKEYLEHLNHALKFLKGQDREILKTLKQKMEEASANLEFERAGAFLQTIRQIEHVIETDRVVESSTYEDCDALALYRRADDVLIMQLIVRHGKLCGSHYYQFSEILDKENKLLASFIVQHYAEREGKPKTVLLPMKIEDQEIVQDIVGVKLTQPKIGKKKQLLELAHENAKTTFMQVKDREELKERMLLDLQEKCNLTKYPKRIECFDISHHAGSDTVASKVSFTNGEKDKANTRLYKIKEAKKSDDYGAMREVLTRRLLRGKKENDLPDLILVDGGKGQLNIAIDVLKQLDIAACDVASVVKEASRHDKGMTRERLFLRDRLDPIHLPENSPLLFLLQQIRDESHRVAITFHRKSRKTVTIKSWLDDIPGIGKKKRADLLKHFGSVEKIKKSTKAQLEEVACLNKKDVETLLKKINTK